MHPITSYHYLSPRKGKEIMKKATICFCIQDDRVLLGMKKESFGAGKWNGFGGKVEPDESPLAAAVRELYEESGLTASEQDLKQVALVRFYFDKEPKFECHVYLTHAWQNEPIETQEMRPQWFPLNALPFEDMWAADAMWIPLILNGEVIEAEVNFSADGKTVLDFSHKPAKFE